MTLVYLLLGFVLGLILGQIALYLRTKPKTTTVVEFWVFLPTASLPAQDALMADLIRHESLSTEEGMMLSDVRLSIGLVKRAANPSLFRIGGRFGQGVHYEAMEVLESAQSFARLRFVSQTPLGDTRHISFLVKACRSTLRLANGLAIYDASLDRWHFPSDPLWENIPSSQTEVSWVSSDDGGFVETSGLQKLGLKDLRTRGTTSDQRLLVTAIIEQLIANLWSSPKANPPYLVSAFDDRFEITPVSGRGEKTTVNIVRYQSK